MTRASIRATGPCPPELELSRSLAAPPGDALSAHLEACDACRAARRGLQLAVELARELPVPMPTAAHGEELRTALLLAAAPASRPAPPRRRAAWIGAAAVGAVAAAAAIAVGLGSSGRQATTTTTPGSAAVATDGAGAPVHRHGTVRPRPLASFTAATATPDEIVVLHDGTVDVEVAPLHAGERFRVLVGDAEVEVLGTAFAVTARAGALVDVAVAHGLVEVRTRDGAYRLTAGEVWRAPAIVAAAPTGEPTLAPTGTPRRPPSRPAVARAAPAAAPRPPRAADALAYDDAWAAMRAERFAEAGLAFARVGELAPTGPLAEDAGFWFAVATARAGQAGRAAAGFRAFLAGFPRARRVGEASAMLGWLLVDTGEIDEATRRFRAASADPSAEVRASAASGLAALATRAQQPQPPATSIE